MRIPQLSLMISKPSACFSGPSIAGISMMKELWTAQVHLLTPPSQEGNTRCCTNVVTWATDPVDYEAQIATIFARRHWSILRIRQCVRVADCISTTEELGRQIERAEHRPGSCIFGTLFYYPSKPC